MTTCTLLVAEGMQHVGPSSVLWQTRAFGEAAHVLKVVGSDQGYAILNCADFLAFLLQMLGRLSELKLKGCGGLAVQATNVLSGIVGCLYAGQGAARQDSFPASPGTSHSHVSCTVTDALASCLVIPRMRGANAKLRYCMLPQLLNGARIRAGFWRCGNGITGR
mmetsp:Transcript_149610/g.480206  ORF Transcript_149610/g.480206 Transcript_149610/m.480206 type:complete len:164 (+) Transcript_149610:3905-4396(+)